MKPFALRALTPLAAAVLSLPALATPSGPPPLVLTSLPGLTATASSCYLNFGCDNALQWSPAKAVDGVDYDLTGNHSWNAGTHASAASPAWLRLDFGSVYQLDSATLRFTYNKGNFAGFTNVYQFRTSVDGLAWATSASGTLVDSPNPALLNNSFSWAAGEGPLARFVEYRVVGGSHWAALGELQVTGQVAAVPEPASVLTMLAGGAALMVHLNRRRRREG